ncbi:MAG: hypothetical protein ACRELY_27825 [Polyangiaceae bacterium]
MKKVMSIGLHPDVVDYSLFPGLTHEKLSFGLQAQEKMLREVGFDVKMLLVDLGETAEAVARTALQEKKYDAVLIGAGVRTPPPQFMLFEKLINVIHEHAPQARICFNTRPDDTTDAFLRWVKP